MKELDEKFTEFEVAAMQREKDYKQILEQQRTDGEQLKGFEKLKESNVELKTVISNYKIVTRVFFNTFVNFTENSKAPRQLSNF